MQTVILIGIRGDPLCLDRQLAYQNLNRDTVQQHDVIVIGDVWGANNLVCTSKCRSKDHGEMDVTNFLLDLSKRKQQSLLIVPGDIDIAIMKNPSKNRHLLGGSETKRRALIRTLKANHKHLTPLMQSSISNPIAIKKASESLPQVAQLCQFIPPDAWPSAFNVNGEICQPMIASCYAGMQGTELHGLLGDAIQMSIKNARRHPDGNPCGTFLKSAVQNGTGKLNAHHAEVEQLEQISMCFRDMDIHQVNMLQDWRSKKLNWPRFKEEFMFRFGSDIGRVGQIPKEKVHKALDKIMGQ